MVEKEAISVKTEVTSVSGKEIATKKVSSVETEVLNDHLVLKREEVKDKNGKFLKTKEGDHLYNYFVVGKIRNRVVKVDFEPNDKGGYEPLNLVFDFGLPVLLDISEDVRTDFNGVKQSKTIYKAFIVDEDGKVFECQIRPYKSSDLSLLNMLLNVFNN